MSLLLRRLLLALGASCLAATLGWLVLVGVARMRADAVPVTPFRPALEDALLGTVLRTDWSGRHLTAYFDVDVRTNGFGQRGGPRTLERTPGVPRILLLGDSFAFGWGVAEEQCFAERLARLLDADVINAGVPGWNAAQQYLWLSRSGFDWQPDLVLLQLCSNDITDFAFYEYDLDARNLPVAIRTRPHLDAAERRRLLERLAAERKRTPEQLLRELSRSELERLSVEALGDLQASRRAAAGTAPQGPVEALTAEEVRRGLDTGTDFQGRYLSYLVAAISELCAARGVPLRLLTVDATEARASENAAALVAVCAAAGSRCLPSEALLTRRDLDACFFRRDPHWTAEGHRRAGAALAAWLAADPELPFAGRAGR